MYQGEVSGLMAPTGAYLDFVLDVIPYPQHHDPEHGLGERQRRMESRLLTRVRADVQLNSAGCSSGCAVPLAGAELRGGQWRADKLTEGLNLSTL